jgi:hypothetical protein
MTRLTLVLVCSTALGLAPSARAQEQEPTPHITLPSITDDITWNAVESADEEQGTPRRPVAIEYSDGYYTRTKIHKYASFATLPLFATEYWLGQSMYNNTITSGTKTAHGVVGAGIVGLFGVNTVTGVWNMWEARNDPANHKLKLLHGALMIAADVGFVATTTSAPGNSRNVNYLSNEQTHRTLALTSIGIATTSYLLMVFGNK